MIILHSPAGVRKIATCFSQPVSTCSQSFATAHFQLLHGQRLVPWVKQLTAGVHARTVHNRVWLVLLRRARGSLVLGPIQARSVAASLARTQPHAPARTINAWCSAEKPNLSIFIERHSNPHLQLCPVDVVIPRIHVLMVPQNDLTFNCAWPSAVSSPRKRNCVAGVAVKTQLSSNSSECCMTMRARVPHESGASSPSGQVYNPGIENSCSFAMVDPFGPAASRADATDNACVPCRALLPMTLPVTSLCKMACWAFM